MFPITPRNHDSVENFLECRFNEQYLEDIPISKGVKGFLQGATISQLEQVMFREFELEELREFDKELAGNVSEMLMLNEADDTFCSKGLNYFKVNEISDLDDFSGYIEFLAKTYNLVQNFDDKLLKKKVQFVVLDEAVNHFSWGVYLAYQAAGCRGHQLEVSQNEIQVMERGLRLSARRLKDWFEGEKVQLWSMSELFRYQNFSFVEEMHKQGTRAKAGSYFRPREGCKELQNLLHAYKVRNEMEENVDHIVGLFYGGISTAALVSVVMDKPVSYLVHSAHEENFKRGQLLEGTEEVRQLIAGMPHLLRNEGMYTGNVLIVDEVVNSATNMQGAQNFLKEVGSENVYATAAEAGSDLQFEETSFEFRGLNFPVAPSFTPKGMGPLLDVWKYVKSKG